MPRAESRVLLIFLVVFQVLEGDAITGTCTGGVCDAANAVLCNGDESACVCNINFVDNSGTCELIVCTAGSDTPSSTCGGGNTACTTTNVCSCAINHEIVSTTAGTCTQKSCDSAASPPNTPCGDNTACTSGTNKCSCAINFEAPLANPIQCSAIACTSTDSGAACLDSNGYCEISSGTTGTCSCKKNFDGTNLLACTRKTCANDTACSEANSACHTVTNAGCGCDTLYTVDATTGACSTQKTCTVATVTTECGTNTVCEGSGSDLLCFCKSNFKASATGCVQKTCSGTDTANCDTNSQCSSGNCVCADNFVINGRVCECPSTEFSLVGGVCKKKCTETSQCGTKGACSNSVCECEPNYEGSAPTACTQKACSGTNTTNCASKSSCVSDKCVCTSGSFVADSDPLVCAGCEGIFCNFSLLMASLLMFFFSSKRFD